MSLGRTVSHRLRMGVGFVPDHFGSQPPTGVLESERQPPRDADQILRLQAGRGRWAYRHRPSPVLAIRGAVLPVTRRVAVPDIEPDRAIIGENPANLVEGEHDALDVVAQSVIPADLVGNLVVPQRPVWRRGHDRLNAAGRQQAQSVGSRAAHEHRVGQGPQPAVRVRIEPDVRVGRQFRPLDVFGREQGEFSSRHLRFRVHATNPRFGDSL